MWWWGFEVQRIDLRDVFERSPLHGPHGRGHEGIQQQGVKPQPPLGRERKSQPAPNGLRPGWRPVSLVRSLKPWVDTERHRHLKRCQSVAGFTHPLSRPHQRWMPRR